MGDPTLSIVLEYIYKYALTFIICILGSFVRDCYETITIHNKINIVKIIISSIFTSFILTLIIDFFTMRFSLYVVITVIAGFWSFQVVQMFLNFKILISLIKNIGKQISNPITRGVSETIREMQDESRREQERQNNDTTDPPNDNNNNG